MKIKEIITFISVFLFLTVLTQAEVKKEKLKIEGMTCKEVCVKKVNDALAELKGVQDKKVKIGKALVTYDDSKISRKEIVDAITKAGFSVKQKTEKKESADT